MVTLLGWMLFSATPAMAQTAESAEPAAVPPPAAETVPARQAPRVHHIPVVEVAAGKALDIVVSSQDLVALGQLELHYRRAGAKAWRSLGFGQRADHAWVASIPAAEVMAGRLEYKILSKKEGEDSVERFASDSAPQRVQVSGESVETLYARELARFGGKTSRASMMTRFDNFGESGGEPDYLWGVTSDFTYRVLGKLRALRFGVTRMRAETVSNGAAESTGYDSGFAELDFAVNDYVGIKTELQLGANLTRFTSGYRGTVRLGLEPGTHVELYGGYVGDIGFEAGMGLFWDTVPHVPMSTAVEVTSWPIDLGKYTALRLVYAAEFPINPALDVSLRTTYQARTALRGGLGGGVGFAYSF